ncbi:hypothetical protein BC829DRAFT_260677 [Chytridium lagenaria]|nr:hypothetical protein BC829DRAFT_260677 [Chytridium lagenaria]
MIWHTMRFRVFLPYDSSLRRRFDGNKSTCIRFTSNYSSHLTTLTRIQLKRSWSAQAASDTITASSLLQDSISLAKLAAPILPRSLIPPLVITYGRLSFFLRELTKNSSDIRRKLTDIGACSFLDMVQTVISPPSIGPGLQLSILRESLIGLVSTNIESESIEDIHKFALEVIRISRAGLRISEGEAVSEKEYKMLTEGKDGSRQAFEPLTMSPITREAILWKANSLAITKPFLERWSRCRFKQSYTLSSAHYLRIH